MRTCAGDPLLTARPTRRRLPMALWPSNSQTESLEHFLVAEGERPWPMRYDPNFHDSARASI